MFGYEIDVAYLINVIVDFLVGKYGDFLRNVSDGIEIAFDAVVNLLLSAPPPVAIGIVGLVLWKLTNGRVAFFATVSLIFIALMGLWQHSVDTVVLVLFSTVLSIAIAIPIGILMGISDKAAKVMRPLLDLMQTMPAFVYLIPAVMFFGVGKVPAIFATLIFAMPPPIRLTNLGIREVSRETSEAAVAYGATWRQVLFDVQLPLAIPAIMAGINQCIMLSLSMAVIASMIGAGGLGGEVLYGINRLDVGQGFEAGISIVLLAIVLDRIASKIHKSSELDRNA